MESKKRPYTLIYIAYLVAAGCTSSNNDESEFLSDDDPSPLTAATIDTDIIIDSVLSVINAEPLKGAIDVIPTPSEQNSFSLIDPDSPSVRTFECPISGTASVENEPHGSVSYSNCIVGDAQFTGNYRSTGASGISLLNFNEFSMIRGDSRLVVQRGSLEYRENLDPDRTRQWRWREVVFSSVTNDISIDATISEVNIQRTGDDEYRADILAAVRLEGIVVSVSTSTPLQSRNGDKYYTSGQFEIVQDDDFSISIDADGGDAESAVITVTGNGSTESQIRDWSDQFYVDCLSKPWPFRPSVDCE